jgi:hypothetical protein
MQNEGITQLTQKSRLGQNLTPKGKNLEFFVTSLTFKTPKISNVVTTCVRGPLKEPWKSLPY